MSRKEPFALLGTDNWKSYAMFMAAVRLEGLNEPHSAETLYLDALRIDPRNRAARMNLGNMLLRTQDYLLAIEQLKQAIAESVASGERTLDPVYYSGRFRLAAAYYDAAMYGEALRETAGLLHDIDEQLLRASDSIPEAASAGSTARLLHYLRDARPAVAVMLAGMRVRAGEITPSEAFRNCDLSQPSSSFQYNVACTAAICVEILKENKSEETDREAFRQIALTRLAFALRLKPSLAERARSDHSLKYLREEESTRLAFAAIVDRTGRFRAADSNPSPKSMTVDDRAAIITRFPTATEADNDALLSLHAKHAIRSGPLSITTDRSPEFLASLSCRGGKSAVLVRRGATGAISAAGSVTIRRGYLRGTETVVGYLGDLRVERRATAQWRTTLEKAVRDSQMYFASTIIDSNLAARRSLVERSSEIVFEPLMHYQVVNVVGRMFPAFSDQSAFRIHRAADADYEALARFLEHRNELKTFGYVNPLERLKSWPEFSIDRFFLATDDSNQIRATVAVWNPEVVQRFVVNGKLKLSINYLTHLEVDDEATFRELVNAIRKAPDLPRAHCLSFCDDAARPLRGALEGLVRTTMAATIYAVRHRELLPLGTPRHGVGFELALA